MDGDPIADVRGYLYFDGKALTVVSKTEPSNWGEPDWSRHEIGLVGPVWQRQLSAQKVLDSLVEDIRKNIADDYDSTAKVNQLLSQFVTVEEAEIDSDLDEFFGRNPGLLESWLKARKSVISDPEESITRSCSHIETVLKGCLKALSATDYEMDPIEKLIKKTLQILREQSVVDSITVQMLQGVSTICQAVGATRNAKSSSHGKNEDYVPPTPDLAQLVNHLAGVVSVFVMKETSLMLKRQ